MMHEGLNRGGRPRQGRGAIALAILGLWFLCPAAPPSLAAESTLAAPSNDDCVGAIAIPPASLPFLTAPVNLLEASALGEPALCTTSARTVWYTFTPTETADYQFTTCPEAAPATNLYSTVLSVLTAPSCADAFTAVQCSYRDALCGEEFWQPRVTVSLAAGTTYYIVAGALANPVAGQETLQIHASRAVAPSNDKCTAATPVALNVPMPGAWVMAKNDYILPSGTTCYDLPSGPPAPVGQSYSMAAGRDVVYSFTPEATGTYSFKAQHVRDGYNLVLYVASECELRTPPVSVFSCIGAANRNPNSAIWSAAEEVTCLPLAAGQTYYVYVDENGALNAPNQFMLEVTSCSREMEPNDAPGLAAAAASGVEGATGYAGDLDYFALGAPPAGTRVFAVADQVAGNTTAMGMRITDAEGTLEFDDDDNAIPWGPLSPNIAGRPLPGAASYIQISPTSTTMMSEPYRLTYVLQPPGTGLGGSSATPHSEAADANAPRYNAAGNMFFSGEVDPAGDADRFAFCAHAGDEIFASLDSDPLRDNTPFDGSMTLYNTHSIGVGFFDTNATSDNTPGTGSLTALTPNSPGDALTRRVRETGRHRINVSSAAAGPAATGDYLLSIAVNGQIGAAQSVDLAITTNDLPDPVSEGALLTYFVTVTNTGPNIALMASMTDVLPAGTTFDSMQEIWPGGTWTCDTPAAGASGTITCTNPCFVDGGSTTFTITVRVNHCLGPGALLANRTSISSLTGETLLGDNLAENSSTVVGGGNCDDGDACTVDSCDAGLGCQHAAIPLPAEVNDSLEVSQSGTDALVSWTDPPGPFNVYRGSQSGSGSWAYNQACVEPLSAGSHLDSEPPAMGEAFFYLVSRVNACGQESIPGRDSQGAPQPNPSPCS